MSSLFIFSENVGSMTFEEGMAFLERTRRQLDRFDSLPRPNRQTITPEDASEIRPCAMNWNPTSNSRCRRTNVPTTPAFWLPFAAYGERARASLRVFLLLPSLRFCPLRLFPLAHW
jgi:hypothetical protein